MSRLYRGRKQLESGMLDYARERGYLRAGEPSKRRGSRNENGNSDEASGGE